MSTFNQDLHELVEIKVKEGSPNRFKEHLVNVKKVWDQMASKFNKKYSRNMENIMFEIYDELCPDDEIKPISEYLADHYVEELGIYDAPFDEGVVVHLDDYSFEVGRIVLLPDPARIVLQNPETFHREILWQAA